MQPLSNDLRERILIKAIDNHEGSRRTLAARFCVNPSTITRLLQLRRQTGSFDPRPHAGGVAPPLDHDSGSSSRSPPLPPSRRSSQRWASPGARGSSAGAMTPAYGRAPRGERVEASAPASWESVTVIAAMGLDGVRAPLAFPGSVNPATFESYVEQVLVPALHRGDVVVFDNRTWHRSPAVFKAINRAGASVLPLPPYSTDFTPIEEMFSKFKAFLRRVGARAKEHLYDAMGEGLLQVTPRTSSVGSDMPV